MHFAVSLQPHWPISDGWRGNGRPAVGWLKFSLKRGKEVQKKTRNQIWLEWTSSGSGRTNSVPETDILFRIKMRAAKRGPKQKGGEEVFPDYFRYYSFMRRNESPMRKAATESRQIKQRKSAIIAGHNNISPLKAHTKDHHSRIKLFYNHKALLFQTILGQRKL